MSSARCGVLVYPENAWEGPHKCGRAGVVDGYCRTHHPDARLKRARASAERRVAQRAMNLRGYTTEELQAEIERRRKEEA